MCNLGSGYIPPLGYSHRLLYKLPIMFIYTICQFTHTESIVLLSVNKMLFANLSATVSTTIYTLSMKSYVLNEELIRCVKESLYIEIC